MEVRFTLESGHLQCKRLVPSGQKGGDVRFTAESDHARMVPVAPAHSVVWRYLAMSVIASQSEPPTILAANTAQHIAKLNINRSDFAIRVTPCNPRFRESVTTCGV